MQYKSSSPTLENITVLDISRVLAGPLAAQILGDHGATSIKVEPFSGDDTRGYGPPFVDNTAPYYIGLNRNKEGISIDLSKEKGRQLLYKLIDQADVLIENYKLSSWRKWGIEDFSVFRERNPRLVHCRISGFGDDGPMGGMPGYDAAIQAYSGLMSINGGADAPPTRIGVPIIDISAGTNAALGIMLALYERQISGTGQFLELSLFDTALSLLHPHNVNVMYGGEARRTGNPHGNIYPYDLLPTKTVPLYVAVGNDRQFALFCAEVGSPELAEQEIYRNNRLRVQHRDELKDALVSAMRDIDGEELFERLLKRGVPCAPVYSVEQALSLPQARHRNMVVEKDGYRGVGIPVKLHKTPGGIRMAPPSIGQHSTKVLERFSFDQASIDELFKDEIIK